MRVHCGIVWKRVSPWSHGSPRLHTGKRQGRASATQPSPSLIDLISTSHHKEAILVRDASITSQDDLLRPVQYIKTSGDRYDYNIILLITKSFAGWLSNDHKFLRKFLQRCLHSQGHAAKGTEAQLALFTAVVDRIPAPSSRWKIRRVAPTSRNIQDDSAGSSVDLEPVGLTKDEGSEGLAYCGSALLPLLHGMVQADTSQNTESTSTRPDVSMSSTSPPTLSFRFFQSLDDSSDQPICHTSLSLPVANTTFLTGQQSAMSISRWQISGEDVKMLHHQELSKDQSVFVPALRPHPVGRPRTISGEAGPSSEHLAVTTSIVAPLQYLVPEPRRIANSMGNVITKVKDMHSEDQQPASQDLETAVATFLEYEVMETESLTVWALIIPEQLRNNDKAQVRQALRVMQKHKGSDVKEHAKWQDYYIARLILKGATLRRVLSGGGGWGVKAGMLSIDPDTRYPQNGVKSEPVLPLFMQHGESPIMQTITSVGDIVLFFAAPQNKAVFRARPNPGWHVSRQRMSSLEFGVIPSTMDDIPANTARLDKSYSTEKNVQLIGRHFGMLSENGMCISQPRLGDDLPISSKIDVPYARFSQQATDITKTVSVAPECGSKSIPYQMVKSTLASGELLASRLLRSLPVLRSLPFRQWTLSYAYNFMAFLRADVAILQYQQQLIINKHLFLNRLMMTETPFEKRKALAVETLMQAGMDSQKVKPISLMLDTYIYLGLDTHKQFSGVRTNIASSTLRQQHAIRRWERRRSTGQRLFRRHCPQVDPDTSRGLSEDFDLSAAAVIGQQLQSAGRSYSTTRSVASDRSERAEQCGLSPITNEREAKSWRLREANLTILKHMPSSHDLFTKSYSVSTSNPDKPYRSMYYTRKEHALYKAHLLHSPRIAGTVAPERLQAIRYLPAEDTDNDDSFLEQPTSGFTAPNLARYTTHGDADVESRELHNEPYRDPVEPVEVRSNSTSYTVFRSESDLSPIAPPASLSDTTPRTGTTDRFITQHLSASDRTHTEQPESRSKSSLPSSAPHMRKVMSKHGMDRRSKNLSNVPGARQQHSIPAQTAHTGPRSKSPALIRYHNSGDTPVRFTNKSSASAAPVPLLMPSSDTRDVNMKDKSIDVGADRVKAAARTIAVRGLIKFHAHGTSPANIVRKSIDELSIPLERPPDVPDSAVRAGLADRLTLRRAQHLRNNDQLLDRRAIGKTSKFHIRLERGSSQGSRPPSARVEKIGPASDPEAYSKGISSAGSKLNPRHRRRRKLANSVVFRRTPAPLEIRLRSSTRRFLPEGVASAMTRSARDALAATRAGREGRLSAWMESHRDGADRNGSTAVSAAGSAPRREGSKKSDNWSTIERIMAQMRSFDKAGDDHGIGEVDDLRGGGDGFEGGLVGMDERY